MKSIKKYLVIIIMLIPGIIFAQSASDALRYSFLNPTGTARFTSMGGAFGSLGGDLSTFNFNPAGIAIYSRSELSFTPAFEGVGSSSVFKGAEASDSKMNMNFGNIGFVGSYLNNNTEKTTGWVNYNFAIGYNRTNSFHNRIAVVGENATSSLLGTYVAAAKGIAPSALIDEDPFGSYLAYQTYLINPDTLKPGEYRDTLFGKYGHRQQSSTTTRGSMGETYFAFGANYNNRLYLGASLGIANIKYSEEVIYIEDDPKDSIPNFKSFTLTENLNTSGIGYNLKLGAIFRATDWMRLNLAVHTPTAFNLTDNWNSKMKAQYNTTTDNASSPQGKFDYRLTTPAKVMGGVAFIIGKLGLVSADAELVDYSDARLRSALYRFTDENAMVQNAFKTATNLRLGTEWRVDIFSLRAGAAMLGSPYKTANSQPVMNYSAGLGIRQQSFFIDFAYMLSRMKSDNYLYPSIPEGPATVTTVAHSFLVTLGFKY